MANFEIFNQSLEHLLADAGLAPEASLNETRLHRKLEGLDDEHHVLRVPTSLMKLMEPRCRDHLQRKNAGDNWDRILQEKTVQKVSICRFRFGAFEDAPDKFGVTEGLSDAQSALYWMMLTTLTMPIIVDTEQLDNFRPYRITARNPDMSYAFRTKHHETLVHLLNCMDRLTILGEVVKVTHGLNPLFLGGSAREEDFLTENHLWNLNGKTLTTEAILAIPGLVPEANLLAICWKMLADKRRMENARFERRQRKA